MPKVFSRAAAEHFARTYKEDVKPIPGGGCMTAVYSGLGALFGDRYGFGKGFHKDFMRGVMAEKKRSGRDVNSITNVFKALRREGVTGAPMVFHPHGGKWRDSARRNVDSVESAVLDTLADKPQGWHFFAMSANGGYHSVLIAVEKTAAGERVLFMDQFSDGFDGRRSAVFADDTDVTGKLDASIKRIKSPNFGYAKTTIWPLDPEKAADVEVPVDTDGDGVPDATAPATIDVDEHAQAEPVAAPEMMGLAPAADPGALGAVPEADADYFRQEPGEGPAADWDDDALDQIFAELDVEDDAAARDPGGEDRDDRPDEPREPEEDEGDGPQDLAARGEDELDDLSADAVAAAETGGDELDDLSEDAAPPPPPPPPPEPVEADPGGETIA